VRSKTLVAQENEVLLKILCDNIRVLINEMHGLGITPNSRSWGPSRHHSSLKHAAIAHHTSSGIEWLTQ